MTLGIIGAVLIALGIIVALNWESITILSGTGDLTEQQQSVPVPMSPPTNLPLTGTADWPCWRGAQRDGRSLVQGFSKDWSGGLPQLWKIDYLCQGPDSAVWSSPVIQGDRLIVAGRDEGQDVLFCLHAGTGQLLWVNRYPAPAESSHGEGMRATPAIDQDRVYSFGRGGDVVCWNFVTGDILWHEHVEKQGGQAPKWGHSSSPVVVGNQVVVQGGGQARVISYDKMTGQILWKSGQGDAGYAPVVPATIAEVPLLFVFHGHGLAALDPNNGTEFWESSWETSYQVNATTPLVTGDKVFITSGYRTGGQLLQVTPQGTKDLWTNKTIASHHSDPVILDGYIYGYSGQSTQNHGTFKCVALASGEEQWASKDIGWGTCLSIDDHLLCQDIKGNLHLILPQSQGLVKVTQMPKALGDIQGPVWTLPVAANGRLYLRFKQHLVCYQLTDL